MLKRRVIDPRINLSSNELLHPDADRLAADALAALPTAAVRLYPVTSRAIEDIAALIDIDPEELWLAPGSDIALRAVAGAYAADVGSARSMVLQHPNYPAWEEAARSHRLGLRRVGVDAGGPVGQTAALLAAARDTQGCLIAVSVPNGPGGWAIDDKALDDLAQVASERGHLLVIDACYQAFHGSFTDHVRRRAPNVLVVQSLSKSHGLAGARVALVCGARERIQWLARTQLEQCVSGASVELARAMLGRRAAFERMWGEVAGARDHAARQLLGIGLPPLPSRANFVAFRTGSAAAAETIVEGMSDAGYRLRDLSSISSLRGCVRFTIADPAATATAVRCLETVIDERLAVPS